MSLDLGRLSLGEDAPLVTVGGPGGVDDQNPRVLAILLIRSTGHLPQVLAGLRAQRRAPDQIVAVDCTGDPDTTELLGSDLRVIRARPGLRFNDAVTLALRADDPDDERPTWLWLLDDTDRPAMKALANLVRRARTSRTVAAVGAKHRGGPDGSALLDVGIAPGPLSARLTLVEPGERDQGQLDHLSDVYAVPLSGLLVNRDVWQEVDGLDPALPESAGADLDLGRRIRLAGHRVEVAPAAVLTSPPEVTARESVRSRAHRRLTWPALPLLPVAALGVLLTGLLALLGALAGKRPTAGLGALGGSLLALLRVDRVLRSRLRARRQRRIPRRRLRPLLVPTRAAVRWYRDRTLAALPRLQSPAAGEEHGGGGRLLGLLLTGGALLSVAGLHRLLGPGPLSSRATPDLPDSVTGTARAALDSWVPTDLGSPGPPDPFLGVFAALGAVTGSPRLSLLLLTLAALPLAALSAWWAAGALTRRPRIRALAAALWAASPVFLLAVSAGRFGLVVAAVGLPVLARLTGQALAAESLRAGWAWAAAAGLVLVPVAAGVPVFAPVAVLVFGLLAVRGRRLNQLLVPVPALAVLAPTLLAWARAVRSGNWVLPQPMDPVPAGPLPGWAGLLGWPVDAVTLLPDRAQRLAAGLTTPDWLPLPVLLEAAGWALGAAPLVLAVAVLWRCAGGRGRHVVLRSGWLIAALGAALVWAAGLAHSGHLAGRPVPADAWPGTLLVVFGLIVAATAGLGAPLKPALTTGSRFGRGCRRWAIGVVCLLPLLSALGWTAVQWTAPPDGDLQRGSQQRLSALAAGQATSPDQSRTLLVTARAGHPHAELPAMDVSLVRGDGPRVDRRSAFDDVTDHADDPGHRELRDTVVRTFALDDDPRPALAEFGIGAIMVLPGSLEDEAATAQLTAALDSRPGLTAVGVVDDARIWRVDPGDAEGERPAAVRLLTGDQLTAVPSRDGRVDTTVGTGGRLLLTERADPGWQATLDGHPLPAVDAGWQQAFEVPDGGGHLRVWHHSWWHTPWLIGTGTVLLLTALLALPVRRTEEDVA